MNRLAALGAVCATLIALSPPVESAASDELSVHMAQHLLLLVVVAPLGVLALPALRPHPRHWLAATTLAVVVHSVVLVGWHLPDLYDAAQRSTAAHVAEHLAYLAAGFALWACVLPSPRRPSNPAAVLALFLAGLPGTLLGAAMTMAGAPWYESYSGPTALADQQMAGAIMWGLGSLAYLVGGVAVFAAWAARSGLAFSVAPTGPGAETGPGDGPAASRRGTLPG